MIERKSFENEFPTKTESRRKHVTILKIDENANTSYCHTGTGTRIVHNRTYYAVAYTAVRSAVHLPFCVPSVIFSLVSSAHSRMKLIYHSMDTIQIQRNAVLIRTE